MNISEQKATLRKEIRRARCMEHARLEKSRKACGRLMELDAWKRAESVLLYVAHKSEIGTDALLDALLVTNKKHCIVPLCLPEGELKLVEIRSRLELTPGAYGILEPLSTVAENVERVWQPEEIDLAILPGVAFDLFGHRLGQGGGYYDRLLLRLKRDTFTVGLAFECQIVPKIPCEPHDLSVGWIVTEERSCVAKKRTQVWGILGGIACGKSCVSDFFRHRGIPVFDADQYGHELYEHSDIRKALLVRWGNVPGLLTPEGTFNRKKIAEIVFREKNSAELAFLNDLFHTAIYRGWKAFLCDAQKNGEPLVILDAALLLEAGWGKECSELIFVDTPRERQLVFAQSRGWTEAELVARERNQFTIEQKRSAATRILLNDTTTDELHQKVERMLDSVACV